MSKIEWTTKTWNPVTGCDKISTGCLNCYAEKMSKRLAGRCGYKKAPHNFDITFHDDKLNDPYSWKKPAIIFVCSMGDLFHKDVPYEFIDDVMKVIADTPRHTYQVLTKRADRMFDYFYGYNILDDIANSKPLNNLWLGVSAENQRRFDERVEKLCMIHQGAIKLVSCEPLLEDIHIRHMYTRHLNWVIVGGESGHGARSLKTRWIENIVDQCDANNIPLFVKQLGTYWAKENNSSIFKGNDMSEWPEHLRIRQYPRIVSNHALGISSTVNEAYRACSEPKKLIVFKKEL